MHAAIGTRRATGAGEHLHVGLELIAVGAKGVALGTVLFADPSAPSRILDELSAELAAQGLSSLDEARGIAHEGALPARKHLDLGSRV